jgi:hypothetical protein
MRKIKSKEKYHKNILNQIYFNIKFNFIAKDIKKTKNNQFLGIFYLAILCV